MLKAKKPELPVAELMRGGAIAYEPAEADEELVFLPTRPALRQTGHLTLWMTYWRSWKPATSE